MSPLKNLFDGLIGTPRAPRTEDGGDPAPPTGVPAGADPPVVVALVADLVGDRGGVETVRLIEQLGVGSRLEVLRLGKRLKLSGMGGFGDQLASARERGRGWLNTAGADILVWGELMDTGAYLRLRFVGAMPDTEYRPGGFGPGNTLDLPVDYGEELGDLVYAAALAAAVPSSGNRGSRLGKVLIQAVDRLEEWLEKPPGGLDGLQTGSVLTCLGNCIAAAWRLDGDIARLEIATEAYEAALDRIPREKAPLTWILVQNQLATCFETLAGSRQETAPLEAAAGAHRAIVENLYRDAHPGDWASANSRLGAVLYKLAGRQGKASLYRDSAAAFEAALSVYTRKSAPVRWAEVKNQIGVVLLAMGEQVAGTTVLEKSVSTFREVLEVRRRETDPMSWAQTINNMGAASFALAKRNNDSSLLYEATACFEGARDIYAEGGHRRMAEVLEKNLARVQQMLRTRERR